MFSVAAVLVVNVYSSAAELTVFVLAYSAVQPVDVSGYSAATELTVFALFRKALKASIQKALDYNQDLQTIEEVPRTPCMNASSTDEVRWVS